MFILVTSVMTLLPYVDSGIEYNISFSLLIPIFEFAACKHMHMELVR